MITEIIFSFVLLVCSLAIFILSRKISVLSKLLEDKSDEINYLRECLINLRRESNEYFIKLRRESEDEWLNHI